MEGAGVHLRRAFGFGDTQEFDPFLLLDDFRNDRPDDYKAGFPWHPPGRTVGYGTQRTAGADSAGTQQPEQQGRRRGAVLSRNDATFRFLL